MNKQEKLIVALLVLTLLGWVYFANQEAKAKAEYLRSQKAQAVAAAALAQTNSVTNAVTVSTSASTNAVIGTSVSTPATLSTLESVAVTPVADTVPERTFVLSNEVAVVSLTSKGGGIKASKFLKYDKSLDSKDGAVELDFSGAPSLALENIPGLDVKADFTVTVSADARTANLTATTADGLRLNRSVSLTNGYSVAVVDSFQNLSTEVRSVPEYRVALGTMKALSSKDPDTDLAIDVKTTDEKGKSTVAEVNKATKKIGFATQFGSSGGGCKAAMVSPVAPANSSLAMPGPIFWATARERFFLQVLTPALPALGIEVRSVRNVSAPGGALTIQAVSAALVNPAFTVQPGTSVEKDYSLFIGPRKMSELHMLGPDYLKVMRFGTWSFFCRWLLVILNFLYGLIPNYGVAIILLTGMVRLLLYPINKKNADSMRKMQEIQPLIKEVQAKFKADPKKLQAETMRIYGENKVNPLSSCLPMLIQLPVFVALFTVLRSSVELRYAPFLWIADLSQPENLFQNVFGFGINILPIAMAATMALQTYLTPTAGDPSQQKMMMVMMPVMMLVMFYQFPAALGLYWTVSQVFAIFGILRTRSKRNAKKKVGEVTIMNDPERETRQMRRDKQRNA